MKSSEIPKKIAFPFAVNGKKNSIPEEKGAESNSATYKSGFPEITMTPAAAGGLPPFGQDMNGILFDVSGNSRWYMAGMFATFDPVFSAAVGGYPKGAVLQGSDKSRFFISLIEDNTDDPNAESTQWQSFFPEAPKAVRIDRGVIKGLRIYGGVGTSSVYFNTPFEAPPIVLTTVSVYDRNSEMLWSGQYYDSGVDRKKGFYCKVEGPGTFNGIIDMMWSATEIQG